MVTERLTVFQIDRSRGRAVAEALLGPDWDGIVGSDRYSAYRWLASEHRQVCWAHLKREFQKLVDWGPGPRPVGEQALAIHAQLFANWQRFQRGDLERPALAAALAPLADELRAVLEAAATDGHPVAAALARQVLLVWPALWTFVAVDGVEPTNNAAEQPLALDPDTVEGRPVSGALRPAVLWRKGSFGTHSEAGSRFVERLLTVRASCQRQGRALFAFLADGLTAAGAGRPLPSLLS